jgi:hypothetical protein
MTDKSQTLSWWLGGGGKGVKTNRKQNTLAPLGGGGGREMGRGVKEGGGEKGGGC